MVKERRKQNCEKRLQAVSEMIASRPTLLPDGHPHLALTRPPLPGREVCVQRQRRVSLSAWGIAPGDWYPHDQALKARLIQASDWAERESRFSALGLDFHEPWGVAPGSPRRIRPMADSQLNAAPLALRHKRREKTALYLRDAL